MKLRERTIWAATLIIFSSVACQAQDDIFTRLKSYDAQKREAVASLYVQIRQAGTDTAKRSAIEIGLLGVLNDPGATFAGKQEAARMLWEIGTERSVPTLAKLLTDEKFSDVARYGLERNTSAAAGKALIDALPQAKGNVQIGIINSLGNRGEAQAVAALKPFALGSDKPGADAAAVALGKIGTLDAVQVLESIPGQGIFVQQALAASADRLARSGKTGDAVKLYESLAGPAHEPSVQIAALRGLAEMGKSGEKSAETLAIAALHSPNQEVQIATAHILAARPDKESTRQSILLWPSLPPPVQIPLLAGFTARKEASAIPLAHQAVGSSDELLRVVGIHALAVLDGAKSVPTLAKLVATAGGDTRNAAQTALVELPGKDAEQAIDTEARQGDPTVRLALLDIIADRGTSAGVNVLVEIAQGTEERLASGALKAIARTRVAVPTDAILRILVTTKSDSVRDAAQSAVVATAQNPAATANALANQLPHATPEVKASLLTALAQVGGDRALAILTENTQAADAEVKRAAIVALAETWGDSRPLPTLLNIARTDTNRSNKIQALRGYFRLLGQDEKLSADDKVMKVKDGIAVAERPEEKRAGLGVLRECRTTGAVEVAANALGDAALFDDAADTILYLAAEQKKGDATLPAVKGPATRAALNMILQQAKDDSVKAQAQKLL
jgi:HEAT repeat protein